MKQETILEKLSNLEQILQQDEKPFTFNEACKYLDVSKSHLYKLTHWGKITNFKPNGKKLYFKKSDLNKWLFRNQRLSSMELEQKAIDYTMERGAK